MRLPRWSTVSLHSHGTNNLSCIRTVLHALCVCVCVCVCVPVGASLQCQDLHEGIHHIRRTNLSRKLGYLHSDEFCDM